MNKLDTKNYIDVTEEWLKNAKPNSFSVKEQLYFEYNGYKYYVDGKNVVLDYSKKELEIAIWLKNTFGGEIYMLPRINIPEGIKTADYLWNNEYWDLKSVKGISEQTLYHAVRKNEKQSCNFIFEILNEKLLNYNIFIQLDYLFKRTEISFVSTIIIKNGKKFKVYKRKRCDRTVMSARPHL